VTILSIIILEGIPLKLFYAITSLNVIAVIVLSWFFLGEVITKNHIIAGILIMSGIAVFNLI
jgi:drug/metabolite transporter (DMT)-like permease